jgi:hypothetical protein
METQTIIIIAFLLVFFLLIPIGFFFFIIFILKKTKGLNNAKSEFFQNFAKNNNFQYQKEIDYNLINHLDKFNKLNQHSYMRILFKGLTILKNKKDISNYIKGTDGYNVWEIFEARITDYTPNINSSYRWTQFTFFSIKPNLNLKNITIIKKLKFENSLNEIDDNVTNFLSLPKTKKIINEVKELNQIKYPKYKEIEFDKLTNYEIYGSNLNEEALIEIINFLKNNLRNSELEINNNHILIYDNSASMSLYYGLKELEDTFSNIKQLLNLLSKL